jgi:hypothetical protein
LHTFCCEPPLRSAPAGDWLCTACAPGSVQLRPLSAASEQTQRFALSTDLPKAHRPKTTAAGASRLIASSLGIRAPTGASRAGLLAEERRQREEEKLRKAREQEEADAMWFSD